MSKDEHCGSDRIIQSHPGCPMCGAPNCCQTCCKMQRLEDKCRYLFGAIKALMDAAHYDHFEARMSDSEMTAINIMRRIVEDKRKPAARPQSGERTE